MTTPILKFFTYGHLPEGPIRGTSKMFSQLAYELIELTEEGPEQSAGFRKLLEAKDCFVRQAFLDSDG